MQDFNQAHAFINALTAGHADTAIVNWRAIHDSNKAVPAIPRRGTLANVWQELCAWNSQGYGVFAVISEMDGDGLELNNVRSIRAHFVDLDSVDAPQNYASAAAWSLAPSFAVQSSPNKFHIYWPVAPYLDTSRFTIVQRKLRQLFNGDKRVIDATRVMRLPGTLHCKAQPYHLVTCWSLPGYGMQTTLETFEHALQTVNIVDGGGGRHDLGEPTLAAPSKEWLQFALNHIDPNDIDRGDWIKLSAAIKQAGWTVCSEQEIWDMWSAWCARYEHNDLGENYKQWGSIRNTEVGWNAVVWRAPIVNAYLKFGGKNSIAPLHVLPSTPAPMPMQTPSGESVSEPSPPSQLPPSAPGPMPHTEPRKSFPEILTESDQREWFAGCRFITTLGEILTPSGRLLGSTAFNGQYGGKQFIINSVGKTVNEPWQAATRSTQWQVPKADHLRFVPHAAPGELIEDDLGRIGVNTYLPARIKSRPGDITPFLRHMEIMLPVESDREIIYKYFAHNARFPGYKIPWAPVIQSAEGAGKGLLKLVIEHVMGMSYTYFPNAKELVESGSKFNGWMRNKLFILADEIKVDERRDMIEVLKPMISEERIEIQSKGIDQEKEDNFANWCFFSNWKDCIPVNKNARRFSVFYSAIQSKDDLIARVGDYDAYFAALYEWLKQHGGCEFVAHWLLNYPVERGKIAMRAPDTSSTHEAVEQSRTPMEQLIMEAVEDGLAGFRGGWVSTTAVVNRAKAAGLRSPSTRIAAAVLEAMGYVLIGRSPRPYFQEDTQNRSQLYNVSRAVNIADYAGLQGYGLT